MSVAKQARDRTDASELDRTARRREPIALLQSADVRRIKIAENAA
jgi:hypothetical protein